MAYQSKRRTRRRTSLRASAMALSIASPRSPHLDRLPPPPPHLFVLHPCVLSPKMYNSPHRNPSISQHLSDCNITLTHIHLHSVCRSQTQIPPPLLCFFIASSPSYRRNHEFVQQRIDTHACVGERQQVRAKEERRSRESVRVYERRRGEGGRREFAVNVIIPCSF